MVRIIPKLLVCLLVCSPAWCQEPVVWVASPWQQVLRGSNPGTDKSAAIVAARNEYEPFRIIIRAGQQALTNVRVEASDFSGPAGKIDSSNLVLFREHYIHIDAPSPRSHAPVGWYPDALIPCSGGDPAARAAAKYGGLPLSVERNTNQGIWIDLYIPRQTEPGEYSGTITLTADGAPLSSVPIHVKVSPFSLPDTIAMRSNFGGLGSRLANSIKMDPSSKEFAAVEDQYIETLLAHRAIPSSLGNIWPRWTPQGGIDDSASGERFARWSKTATSTRCVSPLPIETNRTNAKLTCATWPPICGAKVGSIWHTSTWRTSQTMPSSTRPFGSRGS